MREFWMQDLAGQASAQADPLFAAVVAHTIGFPCDPDQLEFKRDDVAVGFSPVTPERQHEIVITIETESLKESVKSSSSSESGESGLLD